MAFFSLQGLGNSIINFPLLNCLRHFYDIQVICFNNGSSAFFSAYHPNVRGMRSRFQLLRTTWGTNTDASFAAYPTWRRELSSTLFSPVKTKILMRPRDNYWARLFWDFSADPDPDLHDLENNLNLLRSIPGIEESDVAAALNIRDAFQMPPTSIQGPRILGVHPTASSPVKYYPLAFWTALLNLLEKDFDLVEIFCGRSSSEVAFCQSILASLGSSQASRTKIFSGLDFTTLARKIDSSTYFIGSDSALMHLAALMDKKVLGLWSFANFHLIYPYGNQSQVYVPKETLTASTHEYPRRIPAYMKRASSEKVSSIVRDIVRHDFALKPLNKKEIRFYEF